MDDLASKYAKTDDAAAPASTAAKASSSSSSSSDDSSSDEVVEKKPLGTRLKNVAGRLAFWRKEIREGTDPRRPRRGGPALGGG